jgi:ferredoxin-NADP reductase
VPQDKLTLVVTHIDELSPCVRRYQLRAADGDELPLAAAGAHINLDVPVAGEIHSRRYALCNNPLQREYYEIAVLRDANSRGGSAYIHEHFFVGAEVKCSAPNNHFPLHADASPAVLIAEGIGIAPLVAMAHTLSQRGRRFQIHYAGSNRDGMAFVTELEQQFDRQLQVYPADERALDVMHVLADAPGNAQFYLCGSESLLRAADDSARALGISKDRLHSERFHPEQEDRDKPVILELVRSNELLQVPAEQPLLAAVRAAGINVNFDCCVGDCGSCAVKVLEGEPEHRDHVLSDAAKARGRMCLCVSRAKSEKLVLDL